MTSPLKDNAIEKETKLEKQERIRKGNMEKYDKELEFWKEENPFIFRKVVYSNDVIKMTYYEFLSLLESGKSLARKEFEEMIEDLLRDENSVSVIDTLQELLTKLKQERVGE